MCKEQVMTEEEVREWDRHEEELDAYWERQIHFPYE